MDLEHAAGLLGGGGARDGERQQRDDAAETTALGLHWFPP